MKRVFVTVGTTKFEDLIDVVNSEKFLEVLIKFGFRCLSVQYGNGSVPDYLQKHQSYSIGGESIEIETFNFLPSLQEKFMESDLVITHGGSGSILEGLRAKKKLIVVVNDKLMHNHQTQLASKLNEDNYLVQTNSSGLIKTIEKREWENTAPFPEPYQPEDNPFLHTLNEHLGFR